MASASSFCGWCAFTCRAATYVQHPRSHKRPRVKPTEAWGPAPGLRGGASGRASQWPWQVTREYLGGILTLLYRTTLSLGELGGGSLKHAPLPPWLCHVSQSRHGDAIYCLQGTGFHCETLVCPFLSSHLSSFTEHLLFHTLQVPRYIPVTQS